MLRPVRAAPLAGQSRPGFVPQQQVREEGAYAVLAKANALEAQGREIVHLEIGQPDFQTFANIGMAGIRAITNGQTRYNPPAGLPALRAAIAKDAGSRRGMDIPPGQAMNTWTGDCVKRKLSCACGRNACESC